MQLGSEALLASPALTASASASSPTRPRSTTTSATSPIVLSRLRPLQLDRHLRAAARLPVGPAGQHDRDAARRGPRGGVPIFSLYSETREPTAEMLELHRRARHRPAGRRRAHLHLHLHDGQLPARLRARTACRSSSATGPTRSAACGRRPDARAGLRVASSASSGCRCGTA